MVNKLIHRCARTTSSSTVIVIVQEIHKLGHVYRCKKFHPSNTCKTYVTKNTGKKMRGEERRERGGGGVKNSQARACTMGAPKKKGLENLEVRSGHKKILSRDDEKWNEKNCLGRDLEGWKKVEYSYRATFCFQVGQTFVCLCCTSTGGYDHTNMTAPLPVCSA